MKGTTGNYSKRICLLGTNPAPDLNLRTCHALDLDPEAESFDHLPDLGWLICIDREVPVANDQHRQIGRWDSNLVGFRLCAVELGHASVGPREAPVRRQVRKKFGRDPLRQLNRIGARAPRAVFHRSSSIWARSGRGFGRPWSEPLKLDMKRRAGRLGSASMLVKDV